MTDEANSPLRRRMIEDRTIRKLAPKTQQGYIRTIEDFANFLGRGPARHAARDTAFSRGQPKSPTICQIGIWELGYSVIDAGTRRRR
jgi:hypothetical protein